MGSEGKEYETMIKPYEPLYTVKEVAKILKTNSDVVYGLIKEQQLPGLKLGSMRIRGSDLERFIEKYPTEGGDNNAQTL
ncbi:helix-turn-helix domain-containing protein [[Clostridium] symbiosum]|uniref:helix-turn-helix domain-containing protein n=1 Tax=Clostridium symbiosum TaxID=1512 RepID=UPI002ED07CF5